MSKSTSKSAPRPNKSTTGHNIVRLQIKAAAWYRENVNVANGPTELAALGIPETLGRSKAKLKAIAAADIQALCVRIREVYVKAKDAAAAAKLSLPEEDFWAYSASTSSLAPQEKQGNQHVLLAVKKWFIA